MEREQRPQQTYCLQPDLGDLFIFYINDDVSEQQASRIEDHLAVCAECREELRFYLTAQELGKEARLHG
jgi:Putative zinc-finger